ncbi:hypothetical protein D516_1920 [Rhodobacter sp. AKP1]|nr:hypothetical protein D516_1920 [Rhodobacter sp. AKP1]
MPVHESRRNSQFAATDARRLRQPVAGCANVLLSLCCRVAPSCYTLSLSAPISGADRQPIGPGCRWRTGNSRSRGIGELAV